MHLCRSNFAVQLAISPDGRWVIFSISLGLPRVPNTPIGGQVALVSAEGKTLKFSRELHDAEQGLSAWSPDSRRVAVSIPTRNADNEFIGFPVQVIDVETGQIEQVTESGGSASV